MKDKNLKILEVENLCKSFKDKKVLTDVNFKLNKGEILGILGFSGEGKSTLLNILCGLEDFQKGNIKYFFNDHAISNLSKNIIKENIGYSTQEPSFYEEMTVKENLEYYGDLLKIKKNDLDKKINELLKILKLKSIENNFGNDLSVGMKKRLDLACSLIHSPKLLILDEPTANLDFELRDEFISYVKKINSLGITIIYVSHYVEEIEIISNKVLFINHAKSKLIENKSKNIKTLFKAYVSKFKEK